MQQMASTSHGRERVTGSGAVLVVVVIGI